MAPSYRGKYASLRNLKHMFDSCRSYQDVVKLEILKYNVSNVKNPKPVKSNCSGRFTHLRDEVGDLATFE